MDTTSFDPEKSLGALTIRANRLLSALLRRRMLQAGIDLTAEQWGVLALLWRSGGLSQDELTRIACVDKSSMSRVLSGMEAKGLVERRPDPADSRRKLIRATDKADGLKARSREVAQGVLDLAARDVRPEDHETCLRVLASVIDTLQAQDG